MSTLLQPTTTPLKPSQLSNTTTPPRGPGLPLPGISAKSHAPRPTTTAASSTNSPSSSSLSPNPATLRPLSTAASPSSSGSYAANAQSERVRIDLQRLEEAKRVESLRASFLSPPTSTHHTPTSKRNSIVSNLSASSNSSSSNSSSSSSSSNRLSSPDRDRDRDRGDSSDGGAPTCRSSSRGAGAEDQHRQSLSPLTASAGVGTTPTSQTPSPPASQQPSPDSVLASVLANMSLNADSPSASALSTPAVAETSSSTAPAKSPKRRSFLSKLAGAMDGVSHSTATSTSGSLANHPVKEEAVQTRVDASPTPKPPAKATRRATSKDDLNLLIINSGITELGMSIQEVNTILFEIQELRHTTSAINPSTSPHGSSPSSLTAPFHGERSLSSSLTSAGAIDHDDIYSHEAASLTTSISELDLDGSHTAAKLGATRTEASTLSEVDSALMRLQERLESLAKEYSELESQISPFLDESGAPSGPASFLASKWSTTMFEYEAVQKDAEMLSEELKEDKWLVVFRTVSSQAEDMMRSLEKVLTQSHQFVWDIERRRPTAGTTSVSGAVAGTTSSAAGPSNYTSAPSRSVMTFLSKSLPTTTSPTVPKAYFGDPETMQPLLASFIALHRSLHSKVKYYAPACDRVLKILGKGIADRSTKNGEVLRRFNEMKTRWRNLVERIARIEAEMHGVEEMLRDAAEPSAAAASSPSSSVTTPRRPVSSDKRDSPLRKWANKVTGAGGSARHQNSTPPSRPPFSLRNSANASLAGASLSSPSSRAPTTTTPRASTSAIAIPSSVVSSSKPPVQTRRLSHSPSAPILPPASSPPRPPSSAVKTSRGEGLLTPPRPVLNLDQPVAPSEHRRVSSSSHFGLEPPQPRFASRRTHSPSMSVDGYPEKPRWNSSTKPADLNGRARPQSRNGMAPRAASSMGIRPPSRLDSLARPTSPTFSDASSNFTGARPGTPSRIPISKSRRSSINHASFPRPDLPDDHASIMQRVMSPAPSDASSSRAFLSRSTPASGRQLPSSSNLSPPPRVSSPTGSNYSSASAMARRAFSQTPEPHLLAQASRLAYVRAPRPPPVPVVPRNVRRPSENRHDYSASPGPARSSSRVSHARPGSSLGRSVMSYDASVVSDDDDLEEDAAALAAVRYVPNPLDALDVAISNTINNLPIQLQVTRIDPPLTRAQLAQVEILQAKYLFALTKSQREARRRRAVVCKLVDRLGPRVGRGEKKVVVRAGTGWQDLDAYAMGLLAQGV